MTPKEKAQDLYEKMYHKLKDTKAIFLEYKSDKNSAKQCALIAVDEILEELPEGSIDYGVSARRRYFEEVKKEIEKL
jgi:hypothetical protein